MHNQSESYTVYEAARELGCTSQWIRVLLAEQRLAGAQKIAGQWQIPAAALEEMKQRREAVSA
jgi:predicted transcriptional regulator